MLHQSEGCPRTGYFIPGRDGTGVRQISGVVRVTARAYSMDLDEIGVSCKRNHTFRRKVVFRVAKRGILWPQSCSLCNPACPLLATNGDLDSTGVPWTAPGGGGKDVGHLPVVQRGATGVQRGATGCNRGRLIGPFLLFCGRALFVLGYFFL